MISISASSPNTRAAISNNFKDKLTPTLMLGAKTIATCSPACSIRDFCSSPKPVVPITMRHWLSIQCGINSIVTSGKVKSTITSDRAIAAPKSLVISTPNLPTPANSPASAPSRLDSTRAIAALSVKPSV